MEVPGGAAAEGAEDGGLVIGVTENHHRHARAVTEGFAAHRGGGEKHNGPAEIVGTVAMGGQSRLYGDVVRVLGEKSLQASCQVLACSDNEHDDRDAGATYGRGRWRLGRAHNTETPEVT